MKIQVMLSESADFTPAQEKKIVLGGTFTLYTIVSTKKTPPRPSIGFIPPETIARYKKMPPVITKEAVKYRITDVIITNSGAIKSIVAKAEHETSVTRKHAGTSPTLTLTKAKFISLLGNKITKEDKVGSQSITLTTDAKESTAFFNKTAAKDKQRLKVLDEQIAKLQKQREELAGGSNGVNKRFPSSAVGRPIKNTSSKDKFNIRVDLDGVKKDYKNITIDMAKAKAKSTNKEGTLYILSGDKATRIMVFGPKDPITGQTFRGRSWHFATKAAEKKYGDSE